MRDKDTKLLEEAYQDANAKQEFLGWIEAATDATHGEIFRDYFDSNKDHQTLEGMASLIKEWEMDQIDDYEEWGDSPELVAMAKKIINSNNPKEIIWEYFKQNMSHGEAAGNAAAGIFNSGEYSFGNKLFQMMEREGGGLGFDS